MPLILVSPILHKYKNKRSKIKSCFSRNSARVVNKTKKLLTKSGIRILIWNVVTVRNLHIFGGRCWWLILKRLQSSQKIWLYFLHRIRMCLCSTLLENSFLNKMFVWLCSTCWGCFNHLNQRRRAICRSLYSGQGDDFAYLFDLIYFFLTKTF